jgi:hypothetical protein
MRSKSRHTILLAGAEEKRLEFLSDSAEKIARSINARGLRTEIDQAFAVAIARVGGRPQMSFGQAVNKTRGIDAGTSVGQDQHQSS